MLDPRFYTSLGPIPLGELIAGLDAELLDNKFFDEPISAVGSLDVSEPGQIGFLQSRKYKSGLETAGATACFVPDNLASFVSEANIIPVISRFPRTHFGRVTAKLVSEASLHDAGQLSPEEFPGNKIHPTAIIAKTANIAEDVEIGPYAVIGPGVTIGSGTVIGAHVTLEFTVMGENCFIKPHASIGSRGFGIDGDENGIFDLPHTGRVLIGDRVSIGCHTCIDRGLLGDTEISSDVKMDNLVQIAHNVTVGQSTMLAGHVGLSGSCNVGKGVLMGGNACLADHVDVGDGARIAAYAGVMKNVPPGEVWSGIPAMPLRDHMRIVASTKRLLQKS